MKRLAMTALCLVLAGCATEGGGGGVDFYGGAYYGYDDWWFAGGGCCVNYPGDIGPPSGAHPEHPIARPPETAAPKADTARSMPAPRAAAPMRGGGGGRGGGGRR